MSRNESQCSVYVFQCQMHVKMKILRFQYFVNLTKIVLVERKPGYSTSNWDIVGDS